MSVVILFSFNELSFLNVVLPGMQVWHSELPTADILSFPFPFLPFTTPVIFIIYYALKLQ